MRLKELSIRLHPATLDKLRVLANLETLRLARRVREAELMRCAIERFVAEQIDQKSNDI